MASSQQEEGGEASCRPSPATAATAPSTVGLALCSNDCGFFGTPQTDNLCSFCYKKTLASTTAHMPASLAGDDATETAGISHGFLTPPGIQDASKSGDGARPTCMEVRSVGASKSGDGSPTLIKLKSLGASKSGYGASTLIEVKSLDDTTTGQVDAKIVLPSKPDAGGRCHTCRKRLALGCRFKCRCCVGDQYVFFCSLHRFPDQHSCTFDYKSAGREAISKGNPLVKADKLRHRI